MGRGNGRRKKGRKRMILRSFESDEGVRNFEREEGMRNLGGTMKG